MNGCWLLWISVASWVCLGFLIGNWWGEKGTK